MLPNLSSRVLIGIFALILIAALSLVSLSPPPARALSPSLLISEVYYDPLGTESDEEWIEVYNVATSTAVALSSYKIGDEEEQGGGEGMYRFPEGASIAPGGVIVVARKATGFRALYGFNPHFEFSNSDPEVPDMVRYTAWASGTIALGNTGDEVLLLDETDTPVDVVVYGTGSYTGVVPHATIPQGHSLERFPPDQDTDDCSLDFIDQPRPNPGRVGRWIYLPIVVRNASTR
ncbi:MAG: lamin tail domain-containing protein [Anaerolineae bacterium]